MSASQDFWSRRRAAAAAEEAAEAARREADLQAEAEAALAEKSDAEILAELDLPDPDMLQPGDPVTAFMSRAVPERIRKRALRRLWRVNPVLANLDGLVDYDDDYTDAATVVEGLRTGYQVGKGMLSHIEALAEKAARDAEGAQGGAVPSETGEAQASAGAADDGQSVTPPSDTQSGSRPDAAPASATIVVKDTSGGQPLDCGDGTEPSDPPQPRRMTFSFKTETS